MEKCVQNFMNRLVAARVVVSAKPFTPRLRPLARPLLSLFPRLPALGAWLPLSLLLCACDTAFSQAPETLHNPAPIRTAFFYGSQIPLSRLAEYPRVVIEADNLPDPAPEIERLAASGTIVFAYVSVGEAEGWRLSSRSLDGGLFFGENPAWKSRVADLSQLGWRDFLINERMTRLWQQGYRGFFLDTLDSYQMYAVDTDQRARQACALAAIVRTMHDRFPGVQLLLNRGFEVLPQIAPLASGLVAESLFRSWDARVGQYVQVSQADRDWLLGQLEETRRRYRLPVTVIDYLPREKSEEALMITRQIEALGYAAWVATPALDSLPEFAQ